MTGSKRKLVGRRISPDTELGRELAKLRVQYMMAAEIDMTDETLRRRMLEISQNVDISPALDDAARHREERAVVIRDAIHRAIAAARYKHGSTPTTLGVPAESYDEIAAAVDGHIDIRIVTSGSEADQ